VLVCGRVRGCVRGILDRSGGVVMTRWRIAAWLVSLAVLFVVEGFLVLRIIGIINNMRGNE
jgi:hypothetical protein